MLVIACGEEDAEDLDHPRTDPGFKLPCERCVAAWIEATTNGLDIRYGITNLADGSAERPYAVLRPCPGGEPDQAAQDPAGLWAHQLPRSAASAWGMSIRRADDRARDPLSDSINNPQRGSGERARYSAFSRSRPRRCAIRKYFPHARTLAHSGATNLGKQEYDESTDKMKHADQRIQRMLFPNGLPNVLRMNQTAVGETVEEIPRADLAMEEKAPGDLPEAVASCESVRAFVSPVLLVHSLECEEQHVDVTGRRFDWIKQIGIERDILLNAAPALEQAPGYSEITTPLAVSG